MDLCISSVIRPSNCHFLIFQVETIPNVDANDSIRHHYRSRSSVGKPFVFKIDVIGTWGQFHQHFTRRSQKGKMTDDLTVFFALLGSTRVNA